MSINYRDPLTGELKKLSAPVKVINKIIINGDAGVNIPDYVAAEAERVAAIVHSRQNENTISFFACSDLHYSAIQSHAAKQFEAMLHMGQGMKLIREKVKIDFGVMLGDMLWDVGETQETGQAEIRFVNECLNEGFGSLPQFRSRGNHEDGVAEFSKGQIFANIGAFNTGAVFDSENRIGGYCYRDFEGVKLRVVCMNSSEEGGMWFTAQQVNWLANVLDLSKKGNGWRSIVLCHHPLDWGRSGGTNPIPTITAADGVICSFHGHIHNFLVGAVTGTELKRISIPNACNGRENQYDVAYNVNWKEETTYSKKQGTAEDTSFCVITIDLAKKKIYADHYGAGYDRIIGFDGTEVKSYKITNVLSNATSDGKGIVEEGEGYSAIITANAGYTLEGATVSVKMGGADITSTVYNNGVINIASVTGDVVITVSAVIVPDEPDEPDVPVYKNNLVPKATTAINGTEIYNGVGYKNGAYVSTTGYGTDASTVAVGYLTHEPTDVIYIKGAELSAIDHVRLLAQQADGGAIQYCHGTTLDLSAGIWNSNKGVHAYNVETLGNKYYKVTPVASAFGNQTAYFKISLKGTGENLIITKNEQIE